MNHAEHDLVATFRCRFRELTPMEATCDLSLINFSQPSIAHRQSIKSFVTKYNEDSATVSAFSKNDQEEAHLRRLLTRFTGVKVSNDVCTEFTVNGGRLFCQLASATAEVAFFYTQFPPRPITARARLVPAGAGSNRNRMMQICLVDPRIKVLFPPTASHITHPSQVRYSVISEARSSKRLTPGILFIYVTMTGNLINQNDYQSVATSWGSNLRVPRQLVSNLRVMFPDTEYPFHIKDLMYYLDARTSADRDSFDTRYVGSLQGKPVGEMMELLVAGIDILPERVLEQMYEIIGNEIDKFGLQALEESAVHLGFVIN